jgi:hypothetical protein
MPPLLTREDDASFSSSVVDPQLPVTRPKSSVHFGGVVVHEIQENMEITPREEIWYSKEEIRCIQLRDSLIVSLIQKGMFKESEEHTVRGLERWIQENDQKRLRKVRGLERWIQKRDQKWLRKLTIDTVMYEQHRQLAGGKVNPDDIARASTRVTWKSRELALSQGRRDEDEGTTKVVLTPMVCHETGGLHCEEPANVATMSYFERIGESFAIWFACA